MSDYLKCDAVGCDHLEMIPEIDASMIGKPCPKCGANLLTQTDFDQFVAVKATMNAIFPETEAAKASGAVANIHVHDGQITVRQGAVQ